MTQLGRTLSTAQVADMIGKSARQTARLAYDARERDRPIRENEIPATKLPGRTGSYIFNEADVRVWLAKHSVGVSR